MTTVKKGFLPIIITRFGIGIKDHEWYDYRYEVFKTFGLDCLKYQTNQNFYWLICLDEEPPNEFYEQLKKDIVGHNNIKLLKINNSNDYYKDSKKYDDCLEKSGKQSFIEQYVNFINNNLLSKNIEYVGIIRKDDDDSIRKDYIDHLHNYVKNTKLDLYYIDPEIKEIREKTKSNQVLEFFKPANCDITFKGSWWNEHIYNALNGDIETLKDIFVAKKGKHELYVFYKNNFITCLGKPFDIWGSFDEQIRKLKNEIKKHKNDNFRPLAHIINPQLGYICIKNNIKNYELYDIKYKGGSGIGLCSIIPVKNNNMSHVNDYMYNNTKSHNSFHESRGITFFNYRPKEHFYIYFRGEISDSGLGKSCWVKNEDNEYIKNDFSDEIKNKFCINGEKLNKLVNYDIENKKKFKRVVDQNIYNY
jgi:hypothetical protein